MMKTINISITEETLNKLYERARKENETLNTVVQKILAKEMGTYSVIFPRNNKLKK